MRTTFILFVSSGLGMCDRLNPQRRLRHSGFIGKELNTVWLIAVLFHLMRLIIRCALWSRKYGTCFAEH